MWAWTLVFGLGFGLVVIGLVFFVKKIGNEGAVKVGYGKFALENATNAALVFVIGIGLVVLGATKVSSNPERGRSQTDTLPKAKVEPLPQGSLFGDRFEGDTLDERWQIVSGEWRVEGGKLISRGRAAEVSEDRFQERAWAVLTLDETLPADYKLNARMRIVQGNLGELMVRLAAGRYVRVYLYDIDQDVVLGNGAFTERQAPGQLSPEEVAASLGGGESIVEKSFPVQVGTWYRIRVTVRGNRYQISVGGQEVIDHRDRHGQLSRRGTIGLISNGEVEFDDVIIEKA